MPRNSFALCRYSAPTEPRTFLSEEELWIFQTSRLKSAKHECHRGLFLFSRFTEICYKDMRYLTCEQIIPDTMGHLRIHGNRCKTGGEYTIKFLPAALRLLEKYRGTAPSPLAFDMPKLSSINCSLRRITKQCGISRHITFHAARHTFATTLCSYPKFRIRDTNLSRTAGTSRRISAGLFAEARPPAASSWYVPNTFHPVTTYAHTLHTGGVSPSASLQNISCIVPPSRMGTAGR